MCVQIDEARRKRLTVRINGFRRDIIDVTDRDDSTVAHADIPVPGRRACAVDDLGVANQKVKH